MLAPAARAQVQAGSKSLTSVQVTATLSWQPGEVFAEQPALQIARAGAVAFERGPSSSRPTTRSPTQRAEARPARLARARSRHLAVESRVHPHAAAVPEEA